MTRAKAVKPASAWRRHRLISATLDTGAAAGLPRPEAATWRGWLLGLLAVAAIAGLTPYVDFILRGTRLSFTAFPMASVTLLLVLTGVAALACRAYGSVLGLTRQDLTLAFCMTMVTYALAGFGFFMVWSTTVTIPWYGARPENNWTGLLHPLIQATPASQFFLPPDPPPEVVGAVRPVEWFYQGLPLGERIPWGVWVRPYLLWSLVILLLHGIWFSLAGLLSRRWSEQERLPFPVAQVPDELTSGFAAGGKRQWLLANRLAFWGFALALGIHVWNMAAAYLPYLQSIDLMYRNLDKKYFTEPPWTAIGSFSIQISFTIIGMTFLLSKEVAFSLWFFFLAKKALFLLCGQLYSVELMTDVTQTQGTGALLALALVSFWAARSELGRSFLEALRLRRPAGSEGEVSPAGLWGALLVCGAGVVAWLSALGLDPLWALVSVVLLVLLMTGLARLVAEAGAYAAVISTFPNQLLAWVATPAVIGGKNMFFLTIWDRLLGADYFRIVPLPLVVNALHVARVSGLRQRTAFLGMGTAVIAALGVSFFAYLATIYPSGQNQIGEWYGRNIVANDMERGKSYIERTELWQNKMDEAARTGSPLDVRDQVAQREWGRLGWLGLGGGVLAALSVARSYVFWCPHPAGYVMWMCSHPHGILWFSFFLGWAFKWGLTKYGGMRVYVAWRRFFIGMVVGESVAVILGILLTYVMGHAAFNIWMS